MCKNVRVNIKMLIAWINQGEAKKAFLTLKARGRTKNITILKECRNNWNRLSAYYASVMHDKREGKVSYGKERLEYFAARCDQARCDYWVARIDSLIRDE